jgi:imidazolonepropionase-like amidohydrolase
MSRQPVVIIGLLFGWLLSASAALAAGSNDGGGFVVRHARVFDGHQVLAQADVWVDSGHIKAVGENLAVPPGVKTIDATGETLLPGLIDAHTHAFGNALQEAEIFGVTTELDMFMDVGLMQKVKKDQAEGRALDLADLRSAGTLATAAGGHGTEYGVAIPTLASPAEAQAWVDARIAEGSDYIKIVYDDMGSFGPVRPSLGKKTLKALIEAAHRRRKLAVVHITTQQQAREVIEAGADALAHLFADSAPAPDFAATVTAHHAFVIPTLTVIESVSGIATGSSLTTDPRLMPYLTGANIANLRSSFHSHLNEAYAEQTVKELVAAHVPVLAGTDAPNPGTAHGSSLHRELELLVHAGLAPQQALAAATSVPAAAFHLDDRGAIAPGKRADLLLVKGDPTSDITATRDIVSVWKLGVEDDRAAYRAGVEKERADAAAASAPPPAGLNDGAISDFDDGKTETHFGAGWSISTDSIARGKSVATMKVVDGGADGTPHALEVTGDIDGGLPFAWAGAMFAPGTQPLTPANLSSKKAVSFWTKGDGKAFRVLFLTRGGGSIPATQTFTAGPEWKKLSMPFTAFNGTDGHDIVAIIFVGGPAPGKFDFEIDDVRLE